MSTSSSSPMPPAAACDSARAAPASAGHGTTASDDQPRPVIRGESHTDPTAHIDWFSCTFLSASTRIEGIIESVFLIPECDWKQCAGGWQGYEHRVDLGGFGLLGFGGEHQRGTVHLALNGHGCARIQDWNAVRVWCEAYGARIRRIDLAHDDFSGVSVSVVQALAWFDAGQFTTSGRPPNARLVDDLGSGKGKTLYVGHREHGKLCRVYEKGRQLGDPLSDWCRVEVEFRGQSREIPHDVVVRPSDYLAGAYPCLAYLSQRQDKVRTLKKSAEIGYARMVECLRTQYGPALNAMLRVECGDPFAVLEQAMRPGIPKRLAHLPLPGVDSPEGHAP